MKNKFYLNIKTPCSKDYNSFTPTNDGGYCQFCTKNVVDFTKLSKEEINNFFHNYRNSKICGRFKAEQLNVIYKQSHKRKSFWGYLSGIGFAFVSFFNGLSIQAQEIKNQKETTNNNIITEDNSEQKLITAKGLVFDDLGPLAGANIVLEGTNISTTTDFDGYFVFPQKLKVGDVLIISYVGNTSKKVTISSHSDTNIEIKVDLSPIEFVLMGEVAKKGVFSSKK